VDRVEGWGPLLWELRTRLEAQDLVVVLSSRRGTLGWTRELEKLPGQLSSLVPESFLMVYPSEVDQGAVAAEGGTTGAPAPQAPATLNPKRVVLDASGATYRDVLRNILLTHFEPGAELAGGPRAAGRFSEEEFSSEIRPGVALPHALLPGLETPLMFLGTLPERDPLPQRGDAGPAIFMLLGSSEKRFDHLRLLTRTARFLRTADEVESLLEASDMKRVTAWFAANAKEG
jgi:hypothetical protein